VADVDAAVAAGAAAASRIGEILSRHVIPAPEPQLEQPIGGANAPGGSRSGAGDQAVP